MSRCVPDGRTISIVYVLLVSYNKTINPFVANVFRMQIYVVPGCGFPDGDATLEIEKIAVPL